jgi:hypothetical protein
MDVLGPAINPAKKTAAIRTERKFRFMLRVAIAAEALKRRAFSRLTSGDGCVSSEGK